MKAMKKVLALGLALAMVVTAVPVTSAEAATAKLTAGKTVSKTYYVGKTNTLQLSGVTASKVKSTTWSKSNAKVTLSSKTKTSAKVKAVKAGTATVTAKVTMKSGAKKTYKCKITVKNPVLTVPEKATVIAGETVSVAATKKAPSSATVAYASADETIATVDAKTGEVTGVKAGEVEITATLTCGTKKVTGKTAVTVEAALSAKQTGTKKVTVTSSSDLTDAKITVKKGNNAVNATVEADGKTAVLTLSANIVADTYTVIVDDKETTFDGEASKIASIEIADLAIAKAGVTLPTADALQKATVSYRVLNQFDEDLSKTTTLNLTSSMSSASTVSGGSIDLTLPQGAKEGDLATVVLIEKNTGVNATKTVKISAKSVVSEIALGEIYNKDGKSLTEGTVAINTFYLLVDLKDQYGNAVTSTTSANSDTIITNAAGLTNVTFGGFTTIKVNGEDKLALPVSAGTISTGTGTILIIAKNTGKNAQTSYTVVDGVKVDTFSASPKDIVVGGETVEFDFSAVDTYGKEIAEPTAAMFNTIPPSFSFEKDAATGKTLLKYTAATVANDTPVVVNFVTKTNKVVTVSFTVKQNAYPVAISKVNNFTAGKLNNVKNSFKIEDVVFEDQYGRSMKAEDALNTINTVAYTLDIKAPTTYDNATATYDSNNFAADATQPGITSTDKAKVLAITPSTNSSNTFTLTLKAGGDAKDSKEVTFVSKDIEDLSNFAVKDIALVNGNVTEDVDTTITVTGTADDGTVVELPSSKYTVFGQLATSQGGTTISGKNLYGATDAVSEKEGSFTVVIANKKGTSIDKTVKVSNEASKVATVELKSGNTLTVVSSGAATNAELLALVKVKNQYGADLTAGTDPAEARITIKNVSDTLVATGNGTQSAAISAAPAKAYVELTYVFDSGVTFTTSAKLSK